MMRLVAALLILSGAAFAAAEPPKQRKEQKKAAVKKPAPPKPEIPAAATRIDDVTFVHTDAAGKTTYYTKTPFGVLKSEQAPGGAGAPGSLPVASEAGDGIVVVQETEDSVTFEHKTPFGANRWTSKKSELNAKERAAFERAQPAASEQAATEPAK